MQATEREELRRKLEAATKGPWTTLQGSEQEDYIVDSYGYFIAEMSTGLIKPDRANAAYIAAANPATILALLADLDASEEREAVVKRALVDIHNVLMFSSDDPACDIAVKEAEKALAVAAKAAPHALRNEIAALKARIAELEK